MKHSRTTRDWRILGSLMLLFALEAGACDLCGCASAGAQLGVLPQYNRSFAGFRYQYSSFLHRNVAETVVGNSRVLQDEFHTLEAWGRIMLSENDQLLLSIPYVVKWRKETEADNRTSGVGDISLLYNRILFQKDLMPWSFQWTGGFGARLPTGPYRQRDERQLMMPIGMQVGTGAWAFPLFTQVGLRYKDWGLLGELFAQFHTTNEAEYRLGDYVQTALLASYYARFQSSMMMPHTGLRYESVGSDEAYGSLNADSGGSRWVWASGVDWYVGDWSVGVRANLPVQQRLSGLQPQWEGQYSLQLIHFF